MVPRQESSGSCSASEGVEEAAIVGAADCWKACMSQYAVLEHVWAQPAGQAGFSQVSSELQLYWAIQPTIMLLRVDVTV